MTLGADTIRWSNPEPTLKARIPMNGPSNRVTGYGNHFVELVLAMLRCGADISVMPYFCEPPLPPEFLACMIEPWDFEAPIAIRMANPTRQERRAAHTIGITTWETTRLPPDEVADGLTATDEFIVPCRDNIATIKEHWPDVPVHYVPEGVDSEFFSYVERDFSAKPIKIAAYGALTYRKGIDLIISSFLELFEGNLDYELHIATSVNSLEGAIWHIERAYDNIHVYKLGWQTRETIRDWMADKHFLLAPFRGEGWYMPGCEFKSTGAITIMPDALGPAAYHTPDNGIVIPWHWTDVDHWGPEWHGNQAAERYGQWVGYDDNVVKDTLLKALNTPIPELREMSRRASDQMPFLANWDFAGQETINIFINAYLERTA